MLGDCALSVQAYHLPILQVFALAVGHDTRNQPFDVQAYLEVASPTCAGASGCRQTWKGLGMGVSGTSSGLQMCFILHRCRCLSLTDDIFDTPRPA